jgi:predicted membrane-bound spermidine synthase
VALPPVGTSIERASEQVRFSALAIQSPLAAYRNTPYQHIALGGSQQHVLYTNGQYVTSFPDPVPNELLAHELMVFSEKPTRVLSFGGLETGALRHCLQHPVASVDLVLLDPDAFHLVSHYLSPADRAALDDPRVHIVFDDPRRFLSQPGPPYDLIISLDPDPNTLFLARATSLEFDRLVHSRLAQDGAYVARFSAGPNVQSGDLGRLGASLYRTLRRVFPVVLATPGPDALYVAGDSPTFITLDAKRLTQRYRDRQVTSEIFEPDFFSKLLPPERIATLNDELVKHAHSAKLASDNHPIAFMYALGVRQQIAGSAWVKLLHGAARYPKTVAVTLAIPSLLLFLYQRVRAGAKSVRTAALHAVAVTGASGLATNLVLMVSFQTRVGALYSELGVLNGLFMLGLALGGVFSTRDHRPEPLLRAQKLGWGTTSLLIVVLVFVDYLPAGSFLLWFIHVFMLLVVGFGTGSLFPAASRECLERLHAPVASNTRVVASNLEVWDHAGAAISALFSAVLLVPVLGLLRCIGVFLLLQTIALLLTRFENPPRRKN